jgi:hypothetical protein
MAALLAAGCATTGADLMAGGAVSVVTLGQPTPFTDITVVQTEKELLISGVVQRRVLGTSSVYPGHVDVVVYDAKGAILAEASHEVRFKVFSVKNTTSGLAPLAGFKFGFPIQSLEGTQVRLAFHETTPFSWSTVFDCGNNQAVAQTSRNR